MMTKKKAEQIVKLWNNEFAGSTIQTQTIARVEKCCSGWSIEIHPAGGNDGRAFYHAREMVDVARVFGLSHHIMWWDGELIGVMF